MRRSVIGIFLIVTILSGCRDTSSVGQARRLGSRDFTVDGWAAANERERGAMVASFLRKHDVKSLNRQDVIRVLGDPTSYYEYHEDPAYRVGATQSARDGHALVFVTDKRTGKVTEVAFVPEVGE